VYFENFTIKKRAPGRNNGDDFSLTSLIAPTAMRPHKQTSLPSAAAGASMFARNEFAGVISVFFLHIEGKVQGDGSL
jgi:hypothetical protein